MVLRGWVRQILLNPLEIFLRRHHHHLNSINKYFCCCLLRTEWRKCWFLFRVTFSHLQGNFTQTLFYVTYLVVKLFFWANTTSPKGSFHIFIKKIPLRRQMRQNMLADFVTLQVFFWARRRWIFSKGIIKQMSTVQQHTKAYFDFAHLHFELVKSCFIF